jgi:hypothetical protein
MTLRMRKWDVDWDIVLLVAMSLLVLTGRMILATPLAWAANTMHQGEFDAYEKALARAAIKTPDDSVPLATIDAKADVVEVVVFQYPSLKIGKKTLGDTEKDAMWVALPDQLKKACAGAVNPTLRLQQALGLPPKRGPRSVYRITAKPANIFRPCTSGTSIGASSCAFAFPSRASTSAPAPDFDELRFVENQSWDVYRTRFAADRVEPGDYPYTGYPFTGMGWTYDWNPQSKDHVGVSEFVIRPKSEITVDRELTPQEFCASK